jgi:hypothetical protein
MLQSPKFQCCFSMIRKLDSEFNQSTHSYLRFILVLSRDWMIIGGFLFDNWIYCTLLQLMATLKKSVNTHRLVFSVTLLCSGFQQYCVLASVSSGSCLRCLVRFGCSSGTELTTLDWRMPSDFLYSGFSTNFYYLYFVSTNRGTYCTYISLLDLNYRNNASCRAQTV